MTEYDSPWKKSGRGMGIEVVHDQPDAFRYGEVLIDQPPHLLGKILLRPPLRDVDLTPTPQRLNEQKQIAGTFYSES